MKKVFLLILCFFYAVDGLSQRADTLISNFESVASFEDAIAISSSPAGVIYVVDQGSSSIHELNERGDFVKELGGPGVSAGQFDEPMDIDPTNGLILVVADAGNGRIQRFSSEFLFLESMQVGDYERINSTISASQPRYRQGQNGELTGTGRPIAVRTMADNRMFALDAEEQVVVEWDQDRNVKQVIGEFSEGEGALIDPVSIELGAEGLLFVLDNGYESIRVYDTFGGYLRTMGNGAVTDATKIKRLGHSIAAVFAKHLLVFQERGMPELRIDLELQNSVVDILYLQGTLFILTKRELLRYGGEVAGLLKL